MASKIGGRLIHGIDLYTGKYGNHGLEPDPDKIEAVLNMPTPQDVEDAQRLNGFVTYLSKFLPKLADVMEPIR